MAHVPLRERKPRLPYVVHEEECPTLAAVHELRNTAQKSFSTSTITYVRNKHCHGYYPNKWCYLEQDKKWNS